MRSARKGPALGPDDVASFDLMEHTSDLALVVDENGSLRSVSRSTERALGRDGADLVGLQWRELVHPDDRAATDRAPAGVAPAEVERFRLLDGDGLARWFELVTSPSLGGDDGGGHVLILRDVSHELEMEKFGGLLQRLTRLANETADLETALEQATSDIRTTMEWSLGQAFTGGAGDVRPVGHAQVSPELSTAAADDLRSRALRSGQPECEVAAANTGPRLLTAVPIVTPEGPVAVLLFAGDPEPVSDTLVGMLQNVSWQLGMVAARQADRDALQQREADLERSNEELERFAYVASHDLQEPLRKVVTACELLERRFSDELEESGGGRYVDIAVDAARRMQLLIRDLLAYSRLGRGGEQVAAPVDLGQVVSEVTEELSQSIAEAGAQINVAQLPVVWGARDEMRQVFANLLSNAVKFRGAAPPRIEVGAQLNDREVEVTVCDNGIGIDPEYAERIFDVFRRLHRQDEYGGTGIGLAIAKRIIEHQGGRIWVTSRAGDGSCFHLTLPNGPST